MTLNDGRHKLSEPCGVTHRSRRPRAARLKRAKREPDSLLRIIDAPNTLRFTRRFALCALPRRAGDCPTVPTLGHGQRDEPFMVLEQAASADGELWILEYPTLPRYP